MGIFKNIFGCYFHNEDKKEDIEKQVSDLQHIIELLKSDTIKNQSKISLLENMVINNKDDTNDLKTKILETERNINQLEDKLVAKMDNILTKIDMITFYFNNKKQ